MDKLSALLIGQIQIAPAYVAGSLFGGFVVHIATLTYVPALAAHLGIAGSILYASFMVHMAHYSVFAPGTNAYLVRRNLIYWLASRSLCSLEQGVRLHMHLERIYLGRLHPELARRRFARWDFILSRGLGRMVEHPLPGHDPARKLQCTWQLVQTIDLELADDWFTEPPLLRRDHLRSAIADAEPSLPPIYRAWLSGRPPGPVESLDNDGELTPIRQSRPI